MRGGASTERCNRGDVVQTHVTGSTLQETSSSVEFWHGSKCVAWSIVDGLERFARCLAHRASIRGGRSVLGAPDGEDIA
jgi:hypothetical protein